MSDARIQETGFSRATCGVSFHEMRCRASCLGISTHLYEHRKRTYKGPVLLPNGSAAQRSVPRAGRITRTGPLDNARLPTSARAAPNKQAIRLIVKRKLDAR